MNSAPATVEDGSRTVLTVRGLSKTFLGQRALDDVALDVRGGEVHALLGENGSGKSTLIKCLAGYHEPDPGATVELDGAPVPLPYSPARATQMGMVFVHQDLGLIPNLSVAENFAIGGGYGTGPLSRIKWKAIRRRAAAELAVLGRDVPLDELVGRLSVTSQTIVAIARALASAEESARVLVLDEPTAALPDADVERLLDAIRQIVATGVGVIYVSHRLNEILTSADRATVLRDGRKVDTFEIEGLSEQDLVQRIVGHDVATPTARHVSPLTRSAAPLLEVRGISGHRLRDVGFALHRGEVVGVAGIRGSGRSELARILFGAQRPTGGRILLRGEQVRYRGPRDAIRRGVVLIPEDRRRQGGFLEMPVAQNITLPALSTFWRGGRIRRTAERARARGLISEFRVHPADPDRKFGVLSGGNQQKAVIAKWLGLTPDLLIFDEPVQGIDVGARAEIFQLVTKAAENGAGVLLISSELEEMLDLCSRVLVLRQGRLAADLPREDLSRQHVARLVHFASEDTAAPAVTTDPSRERR